MWIETVPVLQRKGTFSLSTQSCLVAFEKPYDILPFGCWFKKMHVSCSPMICLPAYIIQGLLGIIKANSKNTKCT